MASTTVDKEVLWRGSFDEYATLSLQRVTRLTDGAESMERYHRTVVDPSVDLDDLEALLGVSAGVAAAIKAIGETIRIPASVARWEARQPEETP